MLLYLTNEIIEVISNNLCLKHLLILKTSHTSFENILDNYKIAHFLHEYNVNQLIENSHFTNSLFFQYAENIDKDTMSNFKIQRVFDKNQSDVINTIYLFQILMRFVKHKRKGQFKLLITFRMIQFIKTFYENYNPKCFETFEIFFNILKYNYEYALESYDFNLYELYISINNFLKQKRPYESKAILDKLINNLNITNSII